LLAVAALLPASCGAEDSSSRSVDRVAASLTSVEECLVAAGASRVVTRSQIGGVVRDFELDRVNKPGGAGNGLIEVGEYQRVPPTIMSNKPAPPPAYLLWVAHQADDLEVDPLAAIDDEDSVVMYVQSPDLKAIRASRECLHDLAG
jgi:hypothetical protein